MGIADRIEQLRRRLSGAPRQDEDERLLQLYWNRAELKKEFLRLQGSNYELQEKLRKQESAEQRFKEQQAQLEDHLGNPEAGPATLVHYQLRALWKLGTKRLQRFADHLRRQQEERERHQQVLEFDQERRRLSAEIEQRLLDAHSYADALEARVRLTQQKHDELRGFWNYFRRRRLAADIEPLQAQWEAAAVNVVDLSDEKSAVETRPYPEFPGLSLDGKRLVNTATIACAQQLVTALSANGLSFFAKEAMLKQPADVRYGSREDCVRLMAQLKVALNLMASEDWDLQALKITTDYVRAHASYRNGSDTVPLTDSLEVLPIPAAFSARMEAIGRAGVNVLLDDYWDLYKVLLQ